MAPWRYMRRHFSNSSELVEKSHRLLQLLKVDGRRLRENRDVVVYTRDRTCPDCSRIISTKEPEFLHKACPQAWRYFHGFYQKCPCPLIGVMRIARFGDLRLEQRVKLEADDSIVEEVTKE
ncbi:hypothetical protein BgAZ_207240 [Babesia gibsoni]|uniref:Uncharacterized protein n=1 Tax=Babesia gibsoni TaxID=33632 RepID=A0AAD8UU53_BABGI|nr:hypothetical protein BgAZ_207240 [Babesia gibsoni]